MAALGVPQIEVGRRFRENHGFSGLSSFHEKSGLTIHAEAPTREPIIIRSETPTLEAATGPSLHASKPAPGVRNPTPARADSEAGTGTVLAQLETIDVKGRAPKNGYARDLYGSGWKDPDRNGCDTRNDVLGRDLVSTTSTPGMQGCVIIAGVLKDPYTGTTIDFERGQTTSSKVQIDHIVALSDAWQKGAQQMNDQKRLEFANDPINLLAVDGPTNASKSDGDAATWLPPNKSFRCDYVARQTAVKAKYGLWMTHAEHDAIQRILTIQCPDKLVATIDH